MSTYYITVPKGQKSEQAWLVSLLSSQKADIKVWGSCVLM